MHGKGVKKNHPQKRMVTYGQVGLKTILITVLFFLVLYKLKKCAVLNAQKNLLAEVVIYPIPHEEKDNSVK